MATKPGAGVKALVALTQNDQLLWPPSPPSHPFIFAHYLKKTLQVHSQLSFLHQKCITKKIILNGLPSFALPKIL